MVVVVLVAPVEHYGCRSHGFQISVLQARPCRPWLGWQGRQQRSGTDVGAYM